MADRYYIVTFDLENSQGREAEYSRVRRRLEALVGPTNYYRPLMQCCIVRTHLYAAQIRDSMKQTLGSNCNILVTRLRHGYAHHIRNSSTRLRTDNMLRNIPRG